MFGKTLLLALTLMAAEQAVQRSDAEWAWLNDQRERAFDALMPVAFSSRQIVAYRSYRDLYQDVPESHFMIDIADGPAFSPEKFVATVTTPTGVSIQEQLLALHAGDPQATLDQLLPRVTLRRLSLSEENCPSIRARTDALSRASLGMPDRNVITLHPVVHRILIDTGGTRIDATLGRSNDSLVRWALETLKALQECGRRLK